MSAGERRQRVLVVDDEPMVREVVGRYLEREGFLVTEVDDGRRAIDELNEWTPELVILDLMLPEVSGLDVLKHIRATSETPVILLTARADEPDRVVGLELGADDYVVKPFSPRELAARVRSVLRRTSPAATDKALRFGELSIDPLSREVLRGEVVIELTAREFDLLLFLASSPGQVFNRTQLLRQVWDSSPDWQDPATVTVHIRRLRLKLERDPENPEHVLTVRGVGYRFLP